MSHTKGPWEAETYDLGAFDVAAPHAGRVAGTLVICSRNSHSSRAEEMHANARLIAAAPDLLAALYAILEGMEASGGWKGDDGLFDKGMAAIRKAEGK